MWPITDKLIFMTTLPTLPTHPSDTELAQILWEEYFAPTTTPARAIATMLDDLAEKRFLYDELGTTESEVLAHIIAFAKTTHDLGVLHQTL